MRILSQKFVSLGCHSPLIRMSLINKGLLLMSGNDLYYSQSLYSGI
jgi:hypothetical protein